MKTKISTAQEQILGAMRNGKQLSSLSSTDLGDFGASIGTVTVNINTVKAMLRKGLISENRRWKTSEGISEGKPHMSWHIDYKVAE